MITGAVRRGSLLIAKYIGESGQTFSYKPFPTTPEAALAQTRVGGNRQIFALRAGKQPTNCSLNTSGPPFNKQFPNRFIDADSLFFIFSRRTSMYILVLDACACNLYEVTGQTFLELDKYLFISKTNDRTVPVLPIFHVKYPTYCLTDRILNALHIYIMMIAR